MFKNHDIWLWAFLGVFGFFAARTCHKQLSAVRAATEITVAEGIDDPENDESRNDPSLESLARLALGPNTRTREAAARVIEDIVLRRQTCSLMLDHIAGKDRILRDEGLECLRYIIITKPLNYPFPYVLSLDSVVICLSNLNSEAYEFEIAFRQTGHGYRTPHYSNALAILIRLLRYATNDGGVLPWLESYPFGGHSTVEDKRKSIQQLLSEKYSHEPMYTVMLYAFRIPVLQNGLVGCNLVDKEMVDQGRKTLWIRMEDLGITSNDAEFYRHVRGNITGFEADLARLRARARGGSFEAALEEQYLRRRRREAVVVGEVGRPFEAEDIFVPIHHDTEIVPPNFNLDPDQSQTLETENQITAAEQETISRPSTPELESEESMSE